MAHRDLSENHCSYSYKPNAFFTTDLFRYPINLSVDILVCPLNWLPVD